MPGGNVSTYLNTVTFPEFTDLVRRNWTYQNKNVIRNAKQLFIEDYIGSGNGSTKSYKEVDMDSYADYKPEGANSQKARIGIGYDITMVARTFSKEIDISLEMRNDNRYQEVGSLIVSLNDFCENRMDLDLTHRFTFATATSYTDMNGEVVSTVTGDGLALLSTAHTLAQSSTTYSNRVTGDPAFLQSAYEAALLLGTTQIYNNFGQKRQMIFNTIVTGDDPTTIRQVRQMLESSADVDASHSGVKNVYSGAKRHVILPNLATTASGAYDPTKKRWWFLLATGQGMAGWQAYLGIWIRPTLLTPTSTNNGADIHNYNWTYSTYCRYGIVTVSPRGIIGSAPSN